MIEEWKVGGATRQTGGNWSGRFALPEDFAAWYVTNGRYLEQGQMATVGDALVKWDGSAFKIIDATFASTVEADAWVAKVGAPIATNSTATIAGTLVRYGGAGVGWVASFGDAVGAVYNGTTIPLPTPSVSLLGSKIPVVNPAVPRGYSWLECNGTAWVPPTGELIAGTWRNGASIAAVTPGVAATVVTIWESVVIPDYMLPAGLVYLVRGAFVVKNASGVANALGGVGLCANTYVLSGNASFPVGFSATPDANGQNGGQWQGLGLLEGGIFYNQGNGNRSLTFGTPGSFVSGQTKLRAVARPSGVADQYILDGASVISMGSV